jgi:outer membrane protein assembly factor BamB
MMQLHKIIIGGVMSAVFLSATLTQAYAWKSVPVKKGVKIHYKIPFKPKWVSMIKKGKLLFKYKRKEFSSPRVYQEKIYVGADSGYFYALKKKNGRKLWRTKTKGAVNTVPAFYGDRVFIGDDKGWVYALNVETGDMIWEVQFESETHSQPAVSDHAVYVMSQAGVLRALDRETGNVVWTYSHSLPRAKMTILGTASPLYEGDGATGVLYVGYADGSFVKLQASQGTVIWKSALQAGATQFRDIEMSPDLATDHLYVATFGGYLYCLKKQSGAILWEKEIGSGVGFAHYQDSLIVAGSQGTLYALNSSNGEVIWENNKFPGYLTKPLVYKDMIIVGSSKGQMYFVQADQGDIMAGRFARKGIYSDPILDDRLLLYLSNGGRLYALTLIR